jgi:Protein of unknown function (DUF3828)
MPVVSRRGFTRSCVTVGVLMLAMPGASGQATPEPVQIVRRLYAPYLKNDSSGGISALDAIKPHAAPALRRLIDRENACMRKQQGICNIDADVLIDGQDWQLSGFQVTTAGQSAERMTVHVAFRNSGRATAVEIPFEQSGGRWLISDVVSRPGGTRLTALLKGSN